MNSVSYPAVVSQILAAALGPIMPRGFTCLPCVTCGTAVSVPEDSTQPECSVCRRANLESAAAQAVSDVLHLIRGTDIFSGLTCEERREQLAQLGQYIDPDRNAADAPSSVERDEIESRIELELDEPQPEYDDGYGGGTY